MSENKIIKTTAERGYCFTTYVFECDKKGNVTSYDAIHTDRCFNGAEAKEQHDKRVVEVF